MTRTYFKFYCQDKSTYLLIHPPQSKNSHNEEFGNFCEIAEQVTVTEISMEANENPSEPHSEYESSAPTQTQKDVEMEAEDTNQVSAGICTVP